MAKLIYSAIASLDGYVADEDGKLRLGRAGRGGARLRQRPRAAGRHLPLRAPDVRGDGLLGDRAHRRRPAALHPGLRGDLAGGRQGRVLEDAGDGLQRQDADRARLRPRRGPAAEGAAERDLGVGGPELAAQAFRAGLVDECHLFLAPIVVGGGKRSLPDDVRLELELLDERRFGNGVVYLRYRTGRDTHRSPDGPASSQAQLRA